MRIHRTISAAILFIVCLIFFYFIHAGFRHVLPSSMLRWAAEKWTEGQYGESLKWFANSNISAFSAGWRWALAGFYIRRMRTLDENGKLEDALEKCSQAVMVLNGHDDEGGMSYVCTTIEEKIKQGQ